MNLLLNTHVLLWWLQFSHRLSDSAKAALAESVKTILVLSASIWEIAIKPSSGRLIVPDILIEAPETVFRDNGFNALPITLGHASRIADLQDRHEDPFDRILIAKALSEGMTLVTSDLYISQYDVPTLV